MKAACSVKLLCIVSQCMDLRLDDWVYKIGLRHRRANGNSYLYARLKEMINDDQKVRRSLFSDGNQRGFSPTLWSHR